MAIEYNLRVRVNKEEADPYKIGDLINSLNLSEVIKHWEKIDKQFVDFASTHIDMEFIFPNFLGDGEIKVGYDDFFMQYLVHTAYHRSQIMSVLRMMSKEGIGTDYLFYLSHLENIG